MKRNHVGYDGRKDPDQVVKEQNDHRIKCPFCEHRNPDTDTCEELEIDGIHTKERLRICFCPIFSPGEYKPKVKEVKPTKVRKPRRRTFILTGVKNGMPEFEMKSSVIHIPRRFQHRRNKKRTLK